MPWAGFLLFVLLCVLVVHVGASSEIACVWLVLWRLDSVILFCWSLDFSILW